MLREAQHGIFHLACAHLTVRHPHASLRRRLDHALDRVLDRGHAIGDVVDLPLATKLLANGGRDHVGVVLPHLHLDRQAPGRRRHDEAHVAHAAHGHLHGARNGRGGKREHVDLLAHVLELLLVLDAKALLLVNHHKAEVIRINVGGEQPVRANEHVHRAVREPLERATLLRRRHKARQHRHLEVKRRKPREERLEVLLRQNRRGAQDHDLFGILTALERRAQGHLGLAKAHVAAEQAIHGASRLHVGLDVHDRVGLIERELVGEARLHLLLHRRVRGKRVARHRGAARIEVDQVKGKLLGTLAGLARGPRPVRGVEAREARAAAVRPHVARDAVHLLERHKELVAAGVLQKEVVALLATHLLAHDLGEQRDAVRGVDHVVAGFEREGHARGVHGPRAAMRLGRARGEIRDREDRELRRGNHDASGNRCVHERHAPTIQGHGLRVAVLGGRAQRLDHGDELVGKAQLKGLTCRPIRHGKDHCRPVGHELTGATQELDV